MKRVLIVDDDVRIRTMITKFLQDKWYEVAEVDSGEQALDLYPVFRPDAVLLDIRMPTISGIEVLEQMKQQNPDVCVIMLTGMDESEFNHRKMYKSPDDYLLKPLSMEMIELCLSNHLSRSTLPVWKSPQDI